MNYQILLLSSPAFPHTAAFNEVAETLHHGLRALGLDAPIVLNHLLPGRRPIVLAYHMLPYLPQLQLPADSILYNLEQLPGYPLAQHPQFQYLLRYPVWDYSERNIDYLQQYGVVAQWLPLGWMPQMLRIVPGAQQDIDVLFYGSYSPRRQTVLDALHEAGLRVVHLYGSYGAARDQMIARSKIVLNLHNRDARIFEQVRVSYLLGNGCCVLAEGDESSEIPADLRQAMAIAPYAELVPQCLALLEQAEQRQALGQRGLHCMMGRLQSASLQRLLTA